jgi:hypothetical protein
MTSKNMDVTRINLLHKLGVVMRPWTVRTLLYASLERRFASLDRWDAQDPRDKDTPPLLSLSQETLYHFKALFASSWEYLIQ